MTIRKSVQKRYTPVALFSKKRPLSTTDYRKNTPKRSHPVSTFFKKSLSFHCWLSEKVPKKVTPFRNFFQKTFIFYRGYIQNYPPLCCRFQKKIRKNLHFTTDYQDCHPILLHPVSTFLKKSITYLPGLFPKRHTVALLNSEKSPKNIRPSTEVISKTTPCCTVEFRKNSEKHHLPPLTVASTPLFCNTPSKLFSKIFISPLLYITFFP